MTAPPPTGLNGAGVCGVPLRNQKRKGVLGDKSDSHHSPLCQVVAWKSDMQKKEVVIRINSIKLYKEKWEDVTSS